jgi:beta-N-acetylhexosaminidase
MTASRHRLRRVAALALVAVLAAPAGCSSSTPTDGGTRATSGAGRPGDPTSPTLTSPPSPPTTTTAPEPRTGLPSAGELASARAEVAELTLPQLVGQLFVVRYPGVKARGAVDLVRRYHVGGVVVFASNVPADPDAVGPDLSAMSRAVGKALKADGRTWPAIIAIDQEGGPVQRVAAPLTDLPPGMAHGAADDPARSAAVAAGAGAELRSLGVTMVFAPDADVTIPADPTIAIRSPGADPVRAARVVAAQVRGYVGSGVVPVVKHFPGHGTVTTDSHLGLPVQGASLSTLRSRDWVPFGAAVDAGTPAVMVAHVVVTALDRARPASLSPAVVDRRLRDELGFGGLVVTDALEMAAITQQFGSGEAAVRAIEAGDDILLMPSDIGSAVTAVLAAVRSGRLERDRLVESAARIVATMRHSAAWATGTPEPSSDAARQPARDLAAAALTQVSGTCGGPLVSGSVRVLGGDIRGPAALRQGGASGRAERRFGSLGHPARRRCLSGRQWRRKRAGHRER